MKGVNHTHPDYDKFSQKWERCRHVVAGQDEIHQAGVKYLPKLTDQSDLDYKAYVTRAGFYNATWRTISGLLGMMYRKPPKMDVPGGIEPYLKDVTMAGMSFDTLSRNVADEILEVGRVGIMVDHPTVENVAGLTLDAAARLGLRPMMQIYKAESIINWKHRRVNNQYVLSMVVLKESVPEPDGEFAEKEITQYRVLDLDDSNLYRVRIFRREDDKDEQIGGDLYPLMNSKPLEYIPFAIVGVDGKDSDLDEPPLIDLVDLNLSHYRTNADYEHGCHFTGLPTLFLSGMTEEDGTFYIGSQAAITSPHPDADGKFIEFTGQGLGALEKNLDRKEQQMAILGARMLAAEKKQAETATTAAIHRTGENSILSSIAIAISEALKWGLKVFSEWAGQAGEVIYDLNRDFNPAMMDAAQLTALFAGVQGGHISEEEAFELLQRADIINSEKTLEQHQAEIDAAPPVMPAPAPMNDDDEEDDEDEEDEVV